MIAEFLADHVTRRTPVAPLAGVRLARAPMVFDSSRAHAELGMPETNLRRALIDAVTWLQSRGLVRRRLPKLYAEGVEPAS
jgi:dihydroflavonol-4-reductase